MMIKEIFERYGTGIMVAFTLTSVCLCVGCLAMATIIISNTVETTTALDPGILIAIMLSDFLLWLIICLMWLMYPEECPKCAIEIENVMYKCYNCGSTNTQKIKDYKIWCKDCGKINLRR